MRKKFENNEASQVKLSLNDNMIDNWPAAEVILHHNFKFNNFFSTIKNGRLKTIVYSTNDFEAADARSSLRLLIPAKLVVNMQLLEPNIF